ncbi:MAG TPA: hypothetical protein VKB80_11330 [Kofleriaceae bacterium]|nr:hypothetical protein [Kofleriaceae bacterium]
MSFGRWYPLDQAAAHAPAGPGVYQVRLASGLVAYPTGRSAMIQYGAAADVRAAVEELARAHEGREWLCRFADQADAGAAAGPDAMLAELLSAFRRRFGAPPGFPE